MSRRKREVPVEDKKSSAGPKKGLVAAAIIVILLVAGIGSAAYFMMGSDKSETGIDYGGDSTTTAESGDSGVSETQENPVALISVRSADGSIDGVIKVELYRDKAPITVENFIRYADDGFYDGLVFHRVIPNFVVQGGGYYYDENGDLQYKRATYPPIQNEADNGLSNSEGTIAMARTSDPNSATSQFYFNLKDNTNLDYSENNPGYCVFGKVISGWNLVQDMAKIPTHTESGMSDVPTVHIVIESVTIQGA